MAKIPGEIDIDPTNTDGAGAEGGAVGGDSAGDTTTSTTTSASY